MFSFSFSNNTNLWNQKGSAINGPLAGSESGYSISLSGNGNRILEIAQEWPQSMDRINFTTVIFLENGLPAQGARITYFGLKYNPDNFLGWRFLYRNIGITVEEKTLALSRMQELDPLNSDLKS